MLRRKPTTIQLTQADVDQYEERRQRKLWEQQQAQHQQQAASSQSTDTSAKGNDQSATMKSRIMGGGRAT